MLFVCCFKKLESEEGPELSGSLESPSWWRQAAILNVCVQWCRFYINYFIVIFYVIVCFVYVDFMCVIYVLF